MNYVVQSNVHLKHAITLKALWVHDDLIGTPAKNSKQVTKADGG